MAETKRLLIRNVLHEGGRQDVLVEGNRFRRIAPLIGESVDKVIDGTPFAILPPFYNGHTHAAMSLLRGYGDDCPLLPWLRDYIWPAEAKLTPELIRCGSRLAMVEMLHSGTVFFNDMYWMQEETVRAAEEIGIRAMIGIPIINVRGEEPIRESQRLFEEVAGTTRGDGRIRYSLAPHAVYTVDENLLRWCAEMQHATGCYVHTHLAETQDEVRECLKTYGATPVQLMERHGLLNDRLIAAHAVYITDEERALLARRGVVMVHNPCSNMKLGSGNFNLTEAWNAGCRVVLGTDGCASSNDLDIGSAMKFAAYWEKALHGSPEVCPVQRIFDCATRDSARAFGLDAGEIAEGRLADALLVSLDNPRLVPNRHLLSNMVYAADSSCIDTVICDGRILMQNRHVPDEETIIREAEEAAGELYASLRPTP
jgi:5-methylthioadenosine/S-adenosylhomocysteine deaminase